MFPSAWEGARRSSAVEVEAPNPSFGLGSTPGGELLRVGPTIIPACLSGRWATAMPAMNRSPGSLLILPILLLLGNILFAK